MFLIDGEKYVMQFQDGTFLKQGFYHGLVSTGDGFGIGKTNNLKSARKFTTECQAQRVVYDLGIKEPYELKEFEVIIKLK